MHLHDFSPSNPFRSPHWRWDRAGLMTDGSLPKARRLDDAWAIRAAKFRAKLKAAGKVIRSTGHGRGGPHSYVLRDLT